MTVGDIIEKVRCAFGGEPSKVKRLRGRVASVMDKIRGMEDGLQDVRKRVRALDERVADLKRELQAETSAHNQDFIMDEIERMEKEFARERELATLKGLNVDAARTLRSKLEQLLETAINGGNAMELEDVLDKVEVMGDDLSDVQSLVRKLERPTPSVTAPERSASAAPAVDAAAERAARMARILGTAAPAAPTAAPSAAPATAPSAPTPAPAPAAPAEAPAGVAVAS